MSKNDTEYGKFKALIDTPLVDGFTVFVTTPQDLIYDERNPYCCIYKCPNYNTRCFCPPYSLEYKERALKKGFVIILARTVKYEKLIRSKSKMMLKYRKVEQAFKTKIIEIFKHWNLNNEDIFSTGFPLSDCDRCFKNEEQARKGPKTECFPMPSAEAFYVDILKTMHKFEYSTNFQMEKGATRIGMIFTNEKSCKEFLGQRLDFGDDPFPLEPLPQQKIDEIEKEIRRNIPELEFIIENPEKHLITVEEEFQFFKLWTKIILWRLKSEKNQHTKRERRKKEKIKENIHRIIFNAGFYLSLDFLSEDVARGHSEILDWDGIEIF